MANATHNLYENGQGTSWFLFASIICVLVVLVVGCERSKKSTSSEGLNSAEATGVSSANANPIPANQVPALAKNPENDEQSPTRSVVPENLTPVVPTIEMRLFLDEEPSAEDLKGRNPVNEVQLHKNFTKLALVYEPDLRAQFLFKFCRHILTKEQWFEATELSIAHDYKFQKLIRRRAEILENAYDGYDVNEKLKEIQKETVFVSRKIRSEIMSKILTAEQREILASERDGRLAENEKSRLAAERLKAQSDANDAAMRQANQKSNLSQQKK